MGIPTVERAVINKEKDGKYNLLVEGTNMQVGGRGVGIQPTGGGHQHAGGGQGVGIQPTGGGGQGGRGEGREYDMLDEGTDVSVPT